ncbi:hypothetical protein GGH95_003527, partial [Coemansia sp. RSA 1836]
MPFMQSSVKTFTPKLKIQPQFNIYKTPITITTSTSLLLVGPTVASKTPGGVSDKTNIAAAYLHSHHGIPLSQIKITDAYTDTATGITHIYACQTVDGTKVANGLANVNINSSDQVISSSQSFAITTGGNYYSLITRNNGSNSSAQTTSSSLSVAFQALATYVGTSVDSQTMAGVTIAALASALPGDGLASYSLSGLPDTVAVLGQATAEQSMVQRSDGSLANTWHIVLQQADHWWSAHVNAQTGAVEAINDWVSSSSSPQVNKRGEEAAVVVGESYNV